MSSIINFLQISSCKKCVKQLCKSASADAERFCLVFAVMILVKRKGGALAEIRREHLSPERRSLGGAVYRHALAKWQGKIQVCLWADARYCKEEAAGSNAGADTRKHGCVWADAERAFFSVSASNRCQTLHTGALPFHAGTPYSAAPRRHSSVQTDGERAF